MLPAGLPPSWVLPGAKYDFHFADGKYWGGSLYIGSYIAATQKSAASIMAYNGAGATADTIFTQWKDGIVRPTGTSAQSYMMRISDYGVWCEGGAGNSNNYCLWCRDFTNAAWTKSNMTAAKDQVGADAVSNSASSLTATANNATVLQAITKSNAVTGATIAVAGSGYVANEIVTLTGGTFTTATQIKVLTVSGGVPQTISVQTPGSYTVLPSNPVAQGSSTGSGTGLTVNLNWSYRTVSAWIKRITGSGTVSLTMDNGGTWTDISGLLSSTKYLQVRAPSQQIGSATVGIRLGTSGDKIAADFSQWENDDQATSPIMTTSASNLRGPEMPSFGTPGVSVYNDGLRVLKDLFYGTPVTFLFQYSGNFSTTAPHLLWGTDATGGANGLPFIQGTTAGKISATGFGGATLLSSDSDVSGLFTLNKVAVRFDGFGCSICVNGGQITTASTPTFSPNVATLSHGGLLNNGSNLIPSNGYMKRLSAWQKAITDGDMIKFTTLTPGEV